MSYPKNTHQGLKVRVSLIEVRLRHEYRGTEAASASVVDATWELIALKF